MTNFSYKTSNKRQAFLKQKGEKNEKKKGVNNQGLGIMHPCLKTTDKSKGKYCF